MKSFCNTDKTEAARQEIKRLTSEYLAKGKKITHVPFGVGVGYQATANNKRSSTGGRGITV